MQNRKLEQLRQEERNRVWKERGDRFWGAFLFTKDGKVKSTLLLYSFCLCVVFAAVYAASYVIFVNLLHPLLEGASVATINFVEAAVPTLVGTAVCSLSWLLPEKRMMLASYLWLAVLAIACLVAMMIILGGDAQAQMLFLQFFGLFVPAPILLGGGLSLWLYRRYQRRRSTLTSGRIERTVKP